jgi:3-hydroxyacyl-[acyl-carrier-protein] dehydratase
MSREQILAAIPHRPPMLLLDEVIEWQQERIVCRKTFSADEWFFQGHYPDFPLVPGVLLCEAAMQAGAVLLSKHVTGSGVPVAGRLKDVKFKRMIRPGDTITIETTLDERLGDAFFLSSKVTCEAKLAVTLSFAVTLAKPEA